MGDVIRQWSKLWQSRINSLIVQWLLSDARSNGRANSKLKKHCVLSWSMPATPSRMFQNQNRWPWLFSYPLSMHHCVSQKNHKMEEFLPFKSPWSSHRSLLLENIHLFWVLHLQFITICQNQSYLHNSSLFWLTQWCMESGYENYHGLSYKMIRP